MIRVENVSKDYYLAGGLSVYHQAFFPNNLQSFKAINSISFNVSKGEVLGIIGSNGAGKSTLLKILCGVTPPTEGHIRINGSSVAILELSTGFSEHYTGRENIRRRLSLHGYSIKEIKKLEPEIIEYSELAEVIDEKVQTYSSGMAAKLAFSIVTSIDAEVFLIDEILTVGDAHFQQKSFRRIKEICSSGRTVVIVSHGINFIERLCKRAIWIEKGQIVMDGPAHDVCMKYYHVNSGEKYENSLPKEYGCIESVSVSTKDDFLQVKVIINRKKAIKNLHLQIAVHDNELGILSNLINTADNNGPIPEGTGNICITAKVRKNSGLTNGLVGVVLARANGNNSGSVIEDAWGWDNAKQVSFIVPDARNNNGYVGVPLQWHRCI